MIVTQAINVHLDKQSNPTIETVQSDTGRAVTVALFNQGTPWEPPAGAIGMVRHSILHEGEVYTSAYDTLSDGRAAVTFSGNQLTIHLCPEILSIPGVGELQVGIHHNRVLVATMTVLLRVQRNVGTQGLTPTAYTDLSHHIQNELARQFRNVYDQGSWLENLHHRVNSDYAMGGIDSDGNLDPARNYRICSGMISHWGREVSVTFPAGVKVRCLFYDAEFNCRAETLFFEESFTFCNPQPYLRLEAGYVDDGRIQDLDGLACQIGIFYSGSFQGHIGAWEMTSFGECTDAGYYQFSKKELKNLSDAPDITAGGILEVTPHADTGEIFQTLWTSDGQIWFRKDYEPFRQINAPATFTVNLDAEGNADKTLQEIRKAAEQGRLCLCNRDDFLIPLVQMENVAHFAGVLHGREYRVEIAEDDVTVEVTELGGGGLTKEQIDALDGMFRIAAYTADATDAYAAFRQAFGLDDSGEEGHVHSYTSTVTNATCEGEGQIVHVCSCGHSYTTVLPATGHNYVDGVCTKCGAADPDYEAGGEEPESTEPVYQLAEATAFDGSAGNTYDTGYALFDGEDKAYSIAFEVTVTSVSSNGTIWGCNGSNNWHLRFEKKGGYYNSISYCAGSQANITNGAITNLKMVITRNAGEDPTVYVLKSGAVEMAAARKGTPYHPNNSDVTIIFGGTDAVGTMHDFKVYDRVLTEAEINTYLGVTE